MKEFGLITIDLLTSPLRRLFNARGSVIVVVALISVLLAVMIPVILRLGQSGSKIAAKTTKGARNLKLAEAAVNRAKWKLMDVSENNWQYIISTGPLAGYDFDTTYSEPGEGEFKVRITSNPANAAQILIDGIGRHSQSTEIRSVQVVLEKAPPAAALIAGNVQLATNGYVEWGPVFSYGDIKINTVINNTKKSPRFFAKGKILYGTTLKTSPPYYPGFELPEKPSIDFDYYENVARTQNNIYNTAALPTCGGVPADLRTDYYGLSTNPSGKVYWQNASPDRPGGYPADCTGPDCRCHLKHQATAQDIFNRSDHVYFFDSGMSFYMGYSGRVGIKGTIVSKGNIYATGGIFDLYASTVGIPTAALQEYLPVAGGGIDTAAVGQFPGDTGSQSMGTIFTFNQSFTNISTGDEKAPFFEGLIFAQGDIVCDASFKTFLGAMYSEGQATFSGSTLYSQPAVWDNVRFKSVPITQVSWNETNMAWPEP